jgi:hypothetical protein
VSPTCSLNPKREARGGASRSSSHELRVGDKVLVVRGSITISRCRGPNTSSGYAGSRRRVAKSDSPLFGGVRLGLDAPAATAEWMRSNGSHHSSLQLRMNHRTLEWRT